MRKVYFEEMDNLKDIIELCIKKIDGKIDKSWRELVEENNLPMKPEALSRFAKYMNIYREYLKEQGDSKDLQELIELRKERRKVADQRRELNRTVTELARMENLFETFNEYLEDREPVRIFENPIKDGVLVKNPNGEREAVIFISDVHYGIGVENELNTYNPEVCKENFRQLYQETKTLLSLYNTNKVTILLGGDLISGIIHTNLRLQQVEDVISQVLGVADIIEEFALNLKATGVFVKFIGTVGNHARVMADKKLNLNAENYERIIFKQLEKAGFEVMQDSDVAVFDVAGNKVVALHGNQTKPNNAFEYVVSRKKIIPTAILMAHYHSDMRWDKGCPIIVNGSMVGADEHCLDSGYFAVPHQKIILFEEGLGEILTYKCVFKR